MVVGSGGVAVDAQPGANDRARPGPRRGGRPGSRRGVLRGLAAAAGALLVTPLVAASRPSHRQDTDAAGVFEETYRGRRIRGVRTAAVATGIEGGVFHDGQWQVTVDGRPLHLMRRADGTWLSVVDHYCSYATPLEAARAAVDELGPGRQLQEMGWTHTGGHHGLHA